MPTTNTKRRSVQKKRSKQSAKRSTNPRKKARPVRASTAKRKKPLVSVDGVYCFWINNGPIVANLRELKDAMDTKMDDGQFFYHVGHGKNDFAVWVEEALCDRDCAKALRRVKTLDSASRVIGKYLTQYRM